MKMRFLPDEPITSSLQDLLGLSDFVQLIERSIVHTEPPFVFGVLGEWGSGKTSALRLLENRLASNFRDGEYPVVPIWFNAWQYENETNIIYPLLYAIKRSYDQRVGAIDEAKGFGQKFLQVVATSTLALTDVGLRAATKHFTGEALSLDDVATHLKAVQERPGDLERVLGSWADQVSDLHKAFKELLDSYANELALLSDDFGREAIRFVIIIDDLDRCLPDTVISILENIKNFLAVERCVFVLGLNPRIVYQGIKIKYKGLDIDGRSYLEKILNYSFYMPEPDTDRVSEFVVDQFDKLITDEGSRGQYKSSFVEFGQIAQECQFSNPRQLKRILNRYLLFLSKYEPELQKFHNTNVVRFIIMAEYFPDLFRLFLRDAEEVKAVFVQLGELDFDIRQVENKYGVSLFHEFHQLIQMKKLFDLTLPTGTEKFSLSEQAQLVFSVTRLV